MQAKPLDDQKNRDRSFSIATLLADDKKTEEKNNDITKIMSFEEQQMKILK